jgi:hypothetical protein
MLAQNKGTLHLALRHKTDSEPAKAATVDDSFFDEVDTQVGMADPQETDEFGPRPETVEAPNPDSITAALEKELSGQGTPATAPAEPSATANPVETEPTTWKIQIFAGEEVRIEEVQLPEENEETPEEPAKVSDLWKTIQGVVSKKSK